jgi:hypothetical protein
MNIGATMLMKTGPIALSTSVPPSPSIPLSPSGVNRFYLLGGQSNLDGRGATASLPAEMTGIFNPYAYVFVNNGSFWANIEPGVYNGTLNNDTNRFGPLIPFAYHEGLKHPNDNLFFAIYGQGGTSISAEWAPPSGYSYLNCVNGAYDLGLNALAIAGLTVTTYECFTWYQGETEAESAPGSAAYYDDEGDLMTAVLANTAFTKILNIKISTNLTYNSVVNAAKDNNALRFNMRLVDSEVANPDLGLHLTAAEVIVLGEMMSDELTGF